MRLRGKLFGSEDCFYSIAYHAYFNWFLDRAKKPSVAIWTHRADHRTGSPTT